MWVKSGNRVLVGFFHMCWIGAGYSVRGLSEVYFRTIHAGATTGERGAPSSQKLEKTGFSRGGAEREPRVMRSAFRAIHAAAKSGRMRWFLFSETRKTTFFRWGMWSVDRGRSG